LKFLFYRVYLIKKSVENENRKLAELIKTQKIMLGGENYGGKKYVFPMWAAKEKIVHGGAATSKILIDEESCGAKFFYF